ncbi:hypothetical protein E3U55_09955 [Filobacillus milosensis]|uniref:Regulatory protein YycH-like domain-containing protein n=1 Tax=Filobacillus milosensis TaxID=94137 RepID=A0A4Y8IK30_9BACI|nr:two-component system regulatory protein YycI [Filobacillus milosensis]TFB21133.1 hypothetical protein E3U55_09955 [Filobacillus milosensis]
MQWGQIKTIFIISFLILNLFLVQELIEKINEADLDKISRSTIQEQLEAQGITFENLPESGLKEVYVTAKRYQLTEEDLQALDAKIDADEQTIGVDTAQEVIASQYVEPLDLNLEESFDESIAKIKESVLYGGTFKFWDYYEEENALLFFQEQNNRTVYFNETGVLLVVLNEEGDAIQYRQTLLEEVVHNSEEQTVVDPINAIFELYSNNVLNYEDNISNMKIGYHTLLPLEDGVQVFVPTWEITVNKEDTYFVNAMEAQYIPNNEIDFVIKLKEFLKREIEELKNRSE